MSMLAAIFWRDEDVGINDTAHTFQKILKRIHYQLLMIMLHFTQTAPLMLYTQLAYLEKSHKQKKKMRERGWEVKERCGRKEMT